MAEYNVMAEFSESENEDSESENSADDKWVTLEHNGPCFAPPYEPLPQSVKLYYNGEAMELSENTEEAAGFFAQMLNAMPNAAKDTLICDNFLTDWKEVMTEKEAGIIQCIDECDFKLICQHYKTKKGKDQENLEQYRYCVVDREKQKIGNFKIEPPCLFKGRDGNSKQGKIKKRIEAEDVVINIGRDAVTPSPPIGHEWMDVQHNKKVAWLASWSDTITGKRKYVKLSRSSKIETEKDKKKFDTARQLKSCLAKIRKRYTDDLESEDACEMQRAVALYFIDRFLIRAGNKKGTTIGCCSLCVKHIKLHEKENEIEFDFLGKDNVPYKNRVWVEKKLFENVQKLIKDKENGDKVFDKLTTDMLNSHLSKQMENLSIKVFRTCHASITFQEQLDELTTEDSDMIKTYNQANEEVAKLCNHKKANIVEEAAQQFGELTMESSDTAPSNSNKKMVHSTQNSKLYYMDPRISVAWCTKWNVPIRRIFTTEQMECFAWAIDDTGKDFKF